MRKQFFVRGLFVGALLGILPTCSGGETSTTPSGTSAQPAATIGRAETTATSTSSKPTAEHSPDEAAVRAAIDTYWTEWLAGLNPPDPERPTLLAVTTGEMKQKVVDHLKRLVALGNAGRLSSTSAFDHTTTRVDVSGAKAVARECYVEDIEVFEINGGKVVDNRIMTSTLETSLVLEEGLWRIDSRKTIALFQGVATCDISPA